MGVNQKIIANVAKAHFIGIFFISWLKPTAMDKEIFRLLFFIVD